MPDYIADMPSPVISCLRMSLVFKHWWQLSADESADADCKQDLMQSVITFIHRFSVLLYKFGHSTNVVSVRTD